MDLTKFKGADDAVKLTVRLSIGYCFLLTAAFVSCLIYLTVKIEKAYSQALVIDKNGEVYETSSLPAGSMRKYEYLNHVKTFVTHWYAFDESTYEGNISLALNLIGNKGKELLNEYNDVNMLNSLIQKNIRYGVSIKDVEIHTNTIPAPPSIPAIAPALVVLFQNKLKSISGPNVAPNPAQAKLTIVNITLFSSSAIMIATIAIRSSVSLEILSTSRSEAFLRNRP